MKKNLVNHLSFILDGNKRWAKKNHLQQIDGYKKGIDKIYEITEYCYQNEINYLTLYLLSTENIKRKNSNNFFKLVKKNFDEFINNINSIGNIKINIIGEKNNLPNDILELIKKINSEKKENYILLLNLVFNYGFNYEIKSAIEKILLDIKNYKIKIKDLKLENYFYLKNQPDPDILIRTGGYKRLSNFILKNLTYSEIYFIDTLWPDINKLEIDKIISQFNKIDRNYGL